MKSIIFFLNYLNLYLKRSDIELMRLRELLLLSHTKKCAEIARRHLLIYSLSFAVLFRISTYLVIFQPSLVASLITEQLLIYLKYPTVQLSLHQLLWKSFESCSGLNSGKTSITIFQLPTFRTILGHLQGTTSITCFKNNLTKYLYN